MTPVAGWVLVALVAVLVGVAVPVLLGLYKTLKAAENTLEVTARHVNEALDQISSTLERVNRAADDFERGACKVSSFLTALGGIGDALTRVRRTMGVVASLGPILGGAFLAAFGRRSKRDDKEPDRQNPTEAVEPAP